MPKAPKSNPKAFYNYANSKLKTKSGIGNLEADKGKVTSDKGKAQTLNDFFTSMFTREDTQDIPDLGINGEIKVPLQDLHVTSDDVRKKLEKLAPSKSPGPDQMHPRLLKELSSVIAAPLAQIMNKSISEGYLS